MRLLPLGAVVSRLWLPLWALLLLFSAHRTGKGPVLPTYSTSFGFSLEHLGQ